MVASNPRLHRVYIEGFRAVQWPLTLDLIGPDGQAFDTVVLAGANGSGKTSVLEAILFGLGMEHLIKRRSIRRLERKPRIELPLGARIELDVAMNSGGVLRLVRTARDHSFEDRITGQQHDYPPQDALQNWAVGYFSSWRSPALVGAVKPLAAPDDRPTTGEISRLWRLKQRIIDERSRRGYQPIGGPKGRDEGWLERLNKAWRRFHANDDTTIDVQLVDPNAEDLYADLFILKGGRRLCSIDEASSGELELLSFFGWMTTDAYDSGLVLIDEPELHLHPQWQATIMPALKEFAPNAQFVIATHADAPWDQAFSFQRFLLEPHFEPPEDIGQDRDRPPSEPLSP